MLPTDCTKSLAYKVLLHLKATCFVFLKWQTVFNTPQLGDIYGATFHDRPLNPKK